MKKQISRLILWMAIFLIAAVAAFCIHAKIGKSGENTTIQMSEFFKQFGLDFTLMDGEVKCVVAKIDGIISASGSFTGRFGNEFSLFRHDGIPNPRPRHISCTRNGNNVFIEIEYCKYDDVEFNNLNMTGNLATGKWIFTATATVPLASVGGTKLPADTKIVNANVNGVWNASGLSFTAADESFSYTNTIYEEENKPGENSGEPNDEKKTEPVKMVKIELLSQNK